MMMQQLLDKKKHGGPHTLDKPTCLIERHFISHISPTPAKREPTRLCEVCSSKKDANGKKIRKETRYWGVMIAKLVSAWKSVSRYTKQN
ncbi:hypothetical protein TNCV_985071 [Trichonephila clavipes]|nr:hypothetical protein TNCV_985071 [Trichonephila clavipes]